MNFLAFRKINYLLLLSFLLFIVSCGKENLNVPTNELDKPNFESIIEDNFGDRAKVLSTDAQYVSINGEQLYFVPIEMTFLQDEEHLDRFAVLGNNNIKDIVEIVNSTDAIESVDIAKKYIEDNSNIVDFTGLVIDYDTNYKLENSHYYLGGKLTTAELERKNNAEGIEQINDPLNPSSVSRGCISWFLVVKFGGRVITETYLYTECSRGDNGENTGGGGTGTAESTGYSYRSFCFQKIGSGWTAVTSNINFRWSAPFGSRTVPVTITVVLPQERFDGSTISRIEAQRAAVQALNSMHPVILTAYGGTRSWGSVSSNTLAKELAELMELNLMARFGYAQVQGGNNGGGVHPCNARVL